MNSGGSIISVIILLCVFALYFISSFAHYATHTCLCLANRDSMSGQLHEHRSAVLDSLDVYLKGEKKYPTQSYLYLLWNWSLLFHEWMISIAAFVYPCCGLYNRGVPHLQCPESHTSQARRGQKEDVSQFDSNPNVPFLMETCSYL